MLEGYVGSPLPLLLTLADRDGSKFPRAQILDDSGTQVGPSINLTASPSISGVYVGAWTPATAGMFAVYYDVFDDIGHTILSGYDPSTEDIRVHQLAQDLSFQKLLGHSGENVRDDVLSYDPVTFRPLTFRRRIFPDAATAASSTPGGTGEGEIATITGAATHLDASRWETLLRTRP